MLLFLTKILAEQYSIFNVFNYITLRAVLATLTSLFFSFLIGPFLIRKLNALKLGQTVRSDGPESHFIKSGTPTMGGLLILFSVLFSTLLWADLKNNYVWVVLTLTFFFGLIGFIDDFKKISQNNAKGLSAKNKILFQSLVALVASYYLFSQSTLPQETQLIVPFFKEISFSLNLIGFLILSFFVIVGASNAVNLTDGLDGLAILPSVMIASALAIFSYVAGNIVFAEYLAFPYIPGAGELTIICASLAGAGLAFLWFNAYPAEVFMGDIGSLSIGAAIGVVAVIVRQEIVLFIMAGVFVAETLSVMLQVISFKLTGKRIFRMAPLHHHFELKGWKENQIVVRFWIITMVLVLIGLSTLKLR